MIVVADPDGASLSSNAIAADVDVVITRGKILTGVSAQGDVVTAGSIGE